MTLGQAVDKVFESYNRLFGKLVPSDPNPEFSMGLLGPVGIIPDEAPKK